MIQNIYTLYDNKAKTFNLPFNSPNDGVAKRAIKAAMTADSTLSIQPEDFDLFCVGFFDTETGMIDPAKETQHVVKLTALVDND